MSSAAKRDPWWLSVLSRCEKYAAALVALLIASMAAAFAVNRWSQILVRFVGHLLPFDVIWCARTRERMVALSFDDGPDPATTPQLLDVLSRYRAHATFFMIGSRVRGNEQIVKRIVNTGNEIANHAMFDRPSALLGSSEFEADLCRTDAVLSEYATVNLFRPASGWFTPQMLTILAAHDYRCILATVATLDSEYKHSERQAQGMSKRLKPGDIIVLHEGTERRRGVIRLADILLSDLRKRGYRVVTVSELLNAGSLATGGWFQHRGLRNCGRSGGDTCSWNAILAHAQRV